MNMAMLTVRRIIAIVVPAGIISLVSYLWWKGKKQAFANDDSPCSGPERCQVVSEAAVIPSESSGVDPLQTVQDSVCVLHDLDIPDLVCHEVFISSQYQEVVSDCLDIMSSSVVSSEDIQRKCSACKRKISEADFSNAMAVGSDEALTVFAEESISISSGPLVKSCQQKRKSDNGSTSDMSDSFTELHSESVPTSPLAGNCVACKRRMSDDKDSGVSGDGDAETDVFVVTRDEYVCCNELCSEVESDLALSYATPDLPGEENSVDFACDVQASQQSEVIALSDQKQISLAKMARHSTEIEDAITPEVVYVAFSALSLEGLEPQEPGDVSGIQNQASCECDSAFTEDYSSDAVSVGDSVGAAMSPIHEVVISEPPDSPHRSWFASSIEETGPVNWADYSDSNLCYGLNDACSLPNINGVQLSKLSISIDVNSSTKISPKKSPKKRTPKKTPTTPLKSKDVHKANSAVHEKKTTDAPSPKTRTTPTKSDSDSNWRNREEPRASKPKRGKSRNSDSSNQDASVKKTTSKTSEPHLGAPTLCDSKMKMTQQFVFPNDQCGKLIGRAGKNISDYKLSTGADIVVESDLSEDPMKVVRITGSASEIRRAANIINKRFNDALSKIEFFDLRCMEKELRYESLPTGEAVDVIVTAIIDAGHLFVQLFAGESFEKDVYKVRDALVSTYFPSSNQYIFPVGHPLEEGMFAVLFADGGWHRIRIESIPDSDCAMVKFMDTGGIAPAPKQLLRQITPEVLKYPFQAIECCLADVAALSELKSYSYEAALLLEELTSGCVLQATVRSVHNGLPHVDLHYQEPYSGEVVHVNRHLLDSGLIDFADGSHSEN